MRRAKWTMGAMLGCALLLSVLSVGGADWPQWRGPNSDNKVTDFKVPKTWPKTLIKGWRVVIGDKKNSGESSPVLVDGKIYVFAKQGSDEVAMCLDADTGKQIWREKYSIKFVDGGGDSAYAGPRSTPAVAEGKIVTLGVNGDLYCRDAKTGKELWKKNLDRPQFHASTSPLIVDGKCIVFAGGKKSGALTAFDLATGTAKWQWKGGSPPYGSPVLMTADDVKQVVTPTQGNALVGVSLADGQLLWQVTLPGSGYTINESTPLIDGQNVIYSAAPKGKGGNMIAVKVEKKGSKFAATEQWKKPLAADKYFVPVLHDGLVFGVSTSKYFFCMDAKTGKEMWQDKSTTSGDCGHLLNVGSVIVALSANSQLVVFEPSDKGFKKIAEYNVGGSPWSCPILTGNRIYVKDKANAALTMWTVE